MAKKLLVSKMANYMLPFMAAFSLNQINIQVCG